MPITHTFVSAKEDGDDETLVRPSNWNAEHIGEPDLLALVLALASKTSNYTVLSTDCVILCDASGGAFTITLPALSAVSDGKVYHIKKIDSSGLSVTIDGSGSETIDGVTMQVITDQYTSILLVKSSSEWGIH